MARTNWNRRFFSSTRGRIITLLRRSSRSVDELAQALDLTHTAVRAHLATLERDGLVQQRSERRGNRKPSSVYDLAPTAEFLFPQSYSQLLSKLLEVLQGQMTPEEGEELLRTVGRRMAAEWTIPPGELNVRLEAAVEVLNKLGGLMERETGEETLSIRGYRCPFAAVVLEHPEVCHLAESLLTELVGVPVQECCERTGPVPCRFVVPV
jgi:predicted ArsR family transcriptional regulator